MSVQLLKAALSFVRGRFTKQEVVEVRQYAGEFNSAEMDQLSYTCPAVLLTVLGWQPKPAGGRITGKGTMEARLAAFVATKSLKSRDDRMDAAMTLAARLSAELQLWTPEDAALPIYLGSIEEGGSRCENLFSRAIDAKGQALWLVSWTQCFRPKPNVPLGELYELQTVEIDDMTRQGVVPTKGVVPTPLAVREQVDFSAL